MDTPRPAPISVAEQDLDDLRTRLARTRWPEAATAPGWQQGTPLGWLRSMCDYWARGYDWRRAEAELNRWEPSVVEVDGLDIHLLRARSPRADALPLVMTHGWPGSVFEFLDVLGPLSDPDGHGAPGAPAFEVVCPSLPGYAWSGKPRQAGWGVERIADAWHEIMTGLGYGAYAAQGGDWGAAVTTALGQSAPEGLVGVHVNMAIVGPDRTTTGDLTAEEEAALTAAAEHERSGTGYSRVQSTRPQTVGYGLVDSPVGLAGWVLEKFWAWTDSGDDPCEAIRRDRLLDNVMAYWLPAAGASSARLYWESFGQRRPGEVKVPAAVSVFPAEIFRPSRRWAQRRYPDLRHWGVLPRGGHFAAMEEPDLFVAELRAAFAAMGAFGRSAGAS
ncbi:MAG TPA: epoxide hydrolase [Acidimicrobiales bacterium]|nr:epoxide hydrolase [Acidimicrobiales bacterium]